MRENELLLENLRGALISHLFSEVEGREIEAIKGLRESLIPAVEAIGMEYLGPSLAMIQESALDPVRTKILLAKINYESISEHMLDAIDHCKRSLTKQLHWITENIASDFKVTEMKILGGDRHNFGSVPLKLSGMNASGQEQHLVLKSTDSSSHKIFSTISSRICELLSIEKITEEIKYEGEDIFARDFSAIKHRFSEKEAQDYFFSYGVLISIANLLQMTDLHFENVIASHSGPSVIDAETIFANASIGSPKWSYRNSELLLSKTSPLSQIASRRFIGANLKELNHADKLFVEYSAFKSIDGSLLMNNEGHLISVEKYLRYLNMGAKAADEAIRKNLKNITDIIYCFSSRPHKYRVIMMPTSYYKVLQLRLWNPGISLSFDSRIAETRSKLVKMHALLRHKGDVSNIVNSEMSALLRGDIPFFYINGNTGDLQDTSNIVYSGFALKSSLLSKNIINKYLNKSERKEIDERFLEWMH